MRPQNGISSVAHMEDDGDPPQLPIIVPGAVIASEPPSSEIGEIPAVVSITRVPAKSKALEAGSGGGLKVRTDLGAPPTKPGPPPLLRVSGGMPTKSALPPMPKLKLGGQRTTGPVGMRFAPPIQIPAKPLNGMMSVAKSPQTMGQLSQPKVGAMPIITNSMSLR